RPQRNPIFLKSSGSSDPLSELLLVINRNVTDAYSGKIAHTASRTAASGYTARIAAASPLGVSVSLPQFPRSKSQILQDSSGITSVSALAVDWEVRHEHVEVTPVI